MIKLMNDKASIYVEHQNTKRLAPRTIDIRSTVKDFVPNDNKNVKHSFDNFNNNLKRYL